MASQIFPKQLHILHQFIVHCSIHLYPWKKILEPENLPIHTFNSLSLIGVNNAYDFSLAKKEFEMEKEAFKDEKEGLLEGLSKERRKFNEEREKGLLEISRIKSELVNQQKKVNFHQNSKYLWIFNDELILL